MRLPLAATGLLLVVGLAVHSTGYALTGVNHCGPGTGPPAGMRCRQDALLLGYRDAAGACMWVCCPPNGDGRTYNCSGDPTPSDYRMDLRRVRAGEWKGEFTPGPAMENPEEENEVPQTERRHKLEHPIVPAPDYRSGNPPD